MKVAPKYQYLFYLLIIFELGFSQKKIINYDYQNNSIDRDFLFYREHFQIKGAAKFKNFEFDKVEVNIYKTKPSDTESINTVTKLVNPVSVVPTTAESSAGITSKEIFQDLKGIYNYKVKSVGGTTKIQSLTDKEVRENNLIIAANSSVTEDLYTNYWERESKDDEFFIINIEKDLSFNWVYIVEFVFYGKEANSETKISDVLSSAYAYTINPYSSTNTVAGSTVTTTNYTSTTSNTLVAQLSQTVQTVSTKTLTKPRNSYRAYDRETIESRFAVTTGVGGIYLGNGSKAPTEVEFLNFVALQYHLGRTFPTTDDPYPTWQSHLSVGVGVLTTSLKYQEKDLSGFGEGANIKPVVCLGIHPIRFFSISIGAIAFKQTLGISTTARKPFTVAPFVTINLSAELLNFFNTNKTPPTPNQE